MKDLFYNSIFQGVRKISALLVCMFFVFVYVISPIKVKAEAFPIPPLWLPMNPYNAQGLEGNYVLLNDDQKKIVHEVIGAVNSVYLGMGGYVLTNPILGVSATREFYQEYGSTFLNTFWSQIMGTSRAMTDFVGSTIYKASTYDTYDDYEADTAPSVSSENHKYFQISPELTVAFKNWYRANGGVEDWQLQTKPFESEFNWNKSNMDLVLTDSWRLAYNNLSVPVKCNISASSSLKNSVCSAPFEMYLFFDTSSSQVYLVNSNGSYTSSFYQSGYWPAFCVNNGRIENIHIDYYNNYKRNSSSFTGSTYLDKAKTIFNSNTSSNRLFDGWAFGGYVYVELSDFVKKVYVGADWSSKQELFNVEDLNIGNADSEYIQNIDDVGYVDINTLIGKIADEVVNLRDVVEESVLVRDGDTAIPYADSLQIAIDKYINQPESGVVIPVDIFGGLTGANGPVSYLWFMTKPLVSYTGDLLGLLTLDGDGTFQFTGLGYIVVGVVTVGIIGGLVTKCLL